MCYQDLINIYIYKFLTYFNEIVLTKFLSDE